LEFHLTEEQRDLQTMARDFTNKELIPIIGECERNDTFPEEAYQKALDMGFHTLTIAKEYGGEGIDTFTNLLIKEELSRGDFGFTATLGAQALGFTPCEIQGNDEQKRYYAQVIQNRGYLALGMTEPNSGSDVAATSTTAVKDGDCYVLNGRKCFISNAPLADIVSVLAVTDKTKGTKGMSLFMVEPKKTPGVSIGKHEDKMGIRLSPTADVIFEDAQIPAANLLGKEGEGFVGIMKTMDKARVSASIGAVGIARAAYEHAVKYSQERVIMGSPIWQHGMVMAMIADMGIDLEAARQMCWRAALSIDYNAPDAEKTKLSAMCKCFATEACSRVVDNALQIMGGYGYMRDYPIEKLYRDIRAFKIVEGTNQIQRIVAARSIIAENRIPKR